ncbi:MAG: hypothetical protein HJJLKODD_02911 [Phycisphaerae bacterium]|nr:hypothetical protein [Phycisphaerae bacterium]
MSQWCVPEAEPAVRVKYEKGHFKVNVWAYDDTGLVLSDALGPGCISGGVWFFTSPSYSQFLPITFTIDIAPTSLTEINDKITIEIGTYYILPGSCYVAIDPHPKTRVFIPKSSKIVGVELDPVCKLASIEPPSFHPAGGGCQSCGAGVSSELHLRGLRGNLAAPDGWVSFSGMPGSRSIPHAAFKIPGMVYPLMAPPDPDINNTLSGWQIGGIPTSGGNGTEFWVKDPQGIKYLYRGDAPADLEGVRLPLYQIIDTTQSDYVLAQFDSTPDYDLDVMHFERQYDPNATGGESYEIQYDYDGSDQLTQLTMATHAGTIKSAAVSYQSDGQLLSKQWLSGGCGEESATYGYGYDADGRLTQVTADAGSGAEILHYWEYDEEGRPVQEGMGSGGGEIVSRSWIYDDENQVTTLRRYQSSSNYEEEKQYRYAPTGELTKTTHYLAVNGGGAALDTLRELTLDEQSGLLDAVTVTYPAGHQYREEFNDYGYKDRAVLLEAGTQTEWQQAAYTYEISEGKTVVDTITDVHNGETDHDYYHDYSGRLVQSTVTYPLVTDGISGNLHQSVDYFYDTSHRLTKQKTEIVENSQYSYVHYFYDDYGNLIVTEASDSNTPTYDPPEWECADSEKRITQYQYDEQNRLTKTIDPECNEQVREYCSAGALLSEISYQGSAGGGSKLSQTEYEYDDFGRLTLVQVANVAAPWSGVPGSWSETGYEYDTYGRRTQMIQDPSGENLQTSYAYDDSNRVTRTTGPDGVWTLVEFDGRGQIKKQTVGHDNVAQNSWQVNEYFYDSTSGNLTKVLEPQGTSTTYTYDGYNRQSTITQKNTSEATLTVTTLEYDEDTGDVIRRTVADSTTEPISISESTYDELGRVWRTRERIDGDDPSNDDSVSLTSFNTAGWTLKNVQKGPGKTNPDDIELPGDAVTEYQYDGLGQVTRTIDPVGSEYHQQYDLAGNVTQSRVKIGSDYLDTVYEYDGGNRVTKQYDATHSSSPNPANPAYRESFYDARGQQIKQVARNSGGTALNQQRWLYDALGRLTRQAVMADASSSSAEAPATDQLVDYDYNAVGRLTKQSSYNMGSASAIDTSYAYDDLGRRTRTTDPGGNYTQLDYDPAGRITQQLVYDGIDTRTQILAYDTANRLTKETWHGATSDIETEYHYDAGGRRTLLIDPLDRETKYEYDLLGRQTKMTEDQNSLARETEYNYDRLGRLTTLTANDGTSDEVTTYGYDLAGRRTTIDFPDDPPSTITYDYDLAGRLTSKTDQRGIAVAYTYDDRGLLLTRGVSNASLSDIYVYDGLGRMTSAKRTVSATEQSESTFAYNDLSQLDYEDEELFNSGTTRRMDYSFDQAGNRTLFTYPSGTSVHLDITYDTLNRANVIQRNDVNLIDYDYTGLYLDRRRMFTDYYACAVWVDYEPTFDEHRRMSNILGKVSTANWAGRKLSDIDYTYDAAGNRDLATADAATNYYGMLPIRSYDYNYDTLHRVTQNDFTPGGFESFDYDLLGNRSHFKDWDDNDYWYEHNLANEYTGLSDSEGGPFWDQLYDPAGNLVTDDSYKGYQYDFENRLIKVFEDDDFDGVLDGGEAVLWSADYDALGRRIRTINGATTTHYYYDGQNVLVEYSWNGSSETLKRYYVHGATYIDERAVMRVIGNTSVDYYYFPRELWSVEGLVNNRGHEVERYRYTAYGDPFIFAVDSRDVNYDGYRSVADRNAILNYAGQAPCTAGPIYDLDGDGDIDSSDAYVAYTLWEQQQSYRALVSLATSGITNPYLFTGQLLDTIDSGSLYLYHYRARAYDPTHGRFMQRDLFAEYDDGMNLYQYVKSSPTNYADFNGHQVCCMGPGCCGWNSTTLGQGYHSPYIASPPASQPSPIIPPNNPIITKNCGATKIGGQNVNIAQVIQDATNSACSHLRKLLEEYTSLNASQKLRLDQCLRNDVTIQNIFNSGTTTEYIIYGMLERGIMDSACDGYNAREYVCVCNNKYCNGPNKPQMVTVCPIVGSCVGKPIYVCLDNLKTSGDINPDNIIHEWMRWWLDGNDPTAEIFSWDTLLGISGTLERCLYHAKQTPEPLSGVNLGS